MNTPSAARPVILTVVATALAFIPLTRSLFWGTMAFASIGGTIVGTILTLLFLAAVYSIWFRVEPRQKTLGDGLATLFRILALLNDGPNQT